MISSISDPRQKRESSSTTNSVIKHMRRTLTGLLIAFFLLAANVSAQTFVRIMTGPVATDVGISLGAEWGDYDDDGDLDLFVTENFNGNNHLYRNNGSTFESIGTGIVVNDGGNSIWSNWADYDNDGDLDLYVANDVDFNYLYQNNGDGSFTKITEGGFVGALENSRVSWWNDYDNDGDLDPFVANFQQDNSLFQNNHDGGFSTLSYVTVANDSGSSILPSWADYDNDGDADLLVANYSSEANFLYQNNGDRTFTKITTGAVVTDVVNSSAGSWADYDNDGDLDLFLANGFDTVEDNALYQNNGDGSFTRIDTTVIGNDGGISLLGSWGDYDNDGDADLFVSNGYLSVQSNYFYENNGDGSFTKIDSGVVVNDSSGSTAGFWGDYDNDGDLDLFVTSPLGQNFLYRNDGGFPANTAPAAPSGLSAGVQGSSVVLSWAASTDNETPTPALSYNLRIGTSPGGCEIMSAHADPATGFRKVAAYPGNAHLQTSWTINNLANGTFYWSVQTVDGALAGSAFAPEDSFTVSTSLPIPFFDEFPVEPAPADSLWFNGSTVVSDQGINPPSPPYSLALDAQPDGPEQILSRYIDLTGYSDSMLVLFYWYQPEGGGGNPPEPDDSLVVELRNSLGLWIQARAYPGQSLIPFQYETIFLDSVNAGSGATFFHENFQFRFRGTSTPASSILLKDVWFVDDVYFGNAGGVPVGIESNGADRIPFRFGLHQNYPNPFNPTTIIQYDLPKDSKVVLKIYNVLGQEVRALVHERQSAGSKAIVWDGKDNTGHSVSSGIYIYRLQAGTFVQSRKMTLLR